MTWHGVRKVGSSPPVRGTLRFRGFIPACAGNTFYCVRAVLNIPVHPRLCGEHRCTWLSSPPRLAVHPRLCGEHIHTRRGSSPQCGSSPPVRGTPTEPDTEGYDRFIPACAGNTWRVGPESWRWPVHPRLCGEHLWGKLLIPSFTGSSPPVRGTPTLRPLIGSSPPALNDSGSSPPVRGTPRRRKASA